LRRLFSLGFPALVADRGSMGLSARRKKNWNLKALAERHKRQKQLERPAFHC
jgi:hypothetical protein